MSRSKKPKQDDYDDWPSPIDGVGSYQSTSTKPGTTKMKHPIGFVRPKKEKRARQKATKSY